MHIWRFVRAFVREIGRRQLRQRRLGVVADLVQEFREGLRQRRDRVRLEQVRAVVDGNVDAIIVQHRAEGQVELGRAQVQPGQIRDRRLAQRRVVSGRLVEAAVDLHQRVVAERAVRGQHLHQPVERHLRVFVDVQARSAHAAQQFREAPRRGHVAADHHDVQAETDQVLQTRSAVCHRCGHADVRLPSETRQQQVVRRHEHHERRAPMPGRELAHRARGSLRHLEPVSRAAEGLHRRA